MNYRSWSVLTSFSLSPEQLVDQVRDAQTALAVAEHYIEQCLKSVD
jgi:hypothetical protein